MNDYNQNLYKAIECVKALDIIKDYIYILKPYLQEEQWRVLIDLCQR